MIRVVGRVRMIRAVRIVRMARAVADVSPGDT
jgi:hypothetical protein